MRVSGLSLAMSLAICAALLACGPDSNAGADGSPNGSDGQTGQTDGQPGSDGMTPTDGMMPTPDAAVPQPAYCQIRCDTPSDCATPSAPYDEDNYECNGNACVYTGCNGDAECQALGNYVCRTSGGSSIPFCLLACSVPADCATASPAYDEDNYDCQSGVCEYTGCIDDAECMTLGNYRCRTVAGGTVATCQLACAGVADCDLGSAPFDTDNYTCEDSVCVYQGCNDNAECQAVGDQICVMP